MGRAPRPVPARLADKLKTIRAYSELSQKELGKLLASDKIPIRPGYISEYERGVREPPLEVLLRYARLGKVSVETLIDDEMNLPGEFDAIAALVKSRKK